MLDWYHEDTVHTSLGCLQVSIEGVGSYAPSRSVVQTHVQIP